MPKPARRAGGPRWVSPTADSRHDGVRAVEVSVRRGRIEVGSRARPDVRVRVTLAVTGWPARWARLRPPELPAVRLRDGVLHLASGAGLVRVQLDVPAGLRVRARVDDGDLTLWGAGGELDLEVAAGVLAGRDLTAASVRAVNSGGEVNLHFAGRPEVVEARARGPVLVVLPGGPYRVDSDAAAEVTVPVAAGALSTIRVQGSGAVSVLAAAESAPI
jgi:hypothetical protein